MESGYHGNQPLLLYITPPSILHEVAPPGQVALESLGF